MNEFYNLILKQVYLIALDYKKEVYKHHIAHIKDINRGRVDCLE